MEVSKVNNIVQALPITQQAWVNLRVDQPQSKNLSDKDLKYQCALIIKRAFDYSTPNSVTDEQILTSQTLELYTILKGKLGVLTIPEVKVGFKNGLDGVYAPYFGLCGKTYNAFLKGFYEDVNRGKSWLAYMDEIEKSNKPKEMTIEEKKEIGRRGAIQRFEDYKKTGELGFIPSATYNILNDLIGVEYDHPVRGKVKTLVTDKNVRIRIFADCKEIYLAGLNNNKKSAEFRKDKDMVKNICTLIECYASSVSFETMVKDKMLKYYFNELIRNNQPLNI